MFVKIHLTTNYVMILLNNITISFPTMIMCLFEVLSPIREYGDVTFAGEGPQILTYT